MYRSAARLMGWPGRMIPSLYMCEKFLQEYKELQPFQAYLCEKDTPNPYAEEITDDYLNKSTSPPKQIVEPWCT